MRTLPCWLVLSLLAGVCWAQVALLTTTGAESLMICLPDNTVFCLAGSSWPEVKPRFEASALGRFYHDQGVRTFVQGIFKAVNPLLGKRLE